MHIFLRPVTLEDGASIVKWRNTPSVSVHCFHQEPITIESNESFFHAKIETGLYRQYIVERIDEELGTVSYPIATVYLKDIDTSNKRCELCIFTSSDQEWNIDSQSIAVKQLLAKAFDELGMHKVYSYIFYKFLDDAELLRKAGFSIEAVLREEAIDHDGNYQDVIRFAIYR